MEGNCSNCRFWVRRNERKGECRWGPPSGDPRRFTMTLIADWCHRHEPVTLSVTAGQAPSEPDRKPTQSERMKAYWARKRAQKAAKEQAAA